MLGKALQKNNLGENIGTQGKKRRIIPVGKFEHQVGKKWSEEEIVALADEFLKWYEKDEANIWFKGFFTKKRVTRSTIERLRERNEYFDEIYSLVKDMQEERLVNLGIDGGKSTPFVMFLMKNILGYRQDGRDDTETEERVEFVDAWPRDKNGNPITDPEVLRALDENDSEEE